MTEPDQRSIAPTIRGVDYSSPTAFDDVISADFKVISGIHLFTRVRQQALLADTGNDYAALESCAWDGAFFGHQRECHVIMHVERRCFCGRSQFTMRRVADVETHPERQGYMQGP